MAYFTSGEVCELAGITQKTLDRWCEEEIVKPAKGGGVQGNPRKWTPMQTLGIAVGVGVLYETQRGCVLPFFATVVRGFERLGEGRLLERFKKGATYFLYCSPQDEITLVSGKHENDAWRADHVDVEAIYARMNEL